ncbi:RNase P modulator RnpM [Selenomonas noxia]|uniref:RNase P modulator RnpM n=1 Tax=Selenomonas noxia TaxID=135083 RepID=UPI0028D07467|nr:YlxR family protein [Selenomonas noxia]
MAETKQPERLCVGCRQLHPKDRLLRIVRSPNGTAAYDPTGKSPGRGAYLCPSAECLRLARRQGGLSWSFKGRVAPAVYDALEDVVRREEDGA